MNKEQEQLKIILDTLKIMTGTVSLLHKRTVKAEKGIAGIQAYIETQQTEEKCN